MKCSRSALTRRGFLGSAAATGFASGLEAGLGIGLCASFCAVTGAVFTFFVLKSFFRAAGFCTVALTPFGFAAAGVGFLAAPLLTVRTGAGGTFLEGCALAAETLPDFGLAAALAGALITGFLGLFAGAALFVLVVAMLLHLS